MDSFNTVDAIKITRIDYELAPWDTFDLIAGKATRMAYEVSTILYPSRVGQEEATEN
jgi:hypothetical protein